MLQQLKPTPTLKKLSNSLELETNNPSQSLFIIFVPNSSFL